MRPVEGTSDFYFAIKRSSIEIKGFLKFTDPGNFLSCSSGSDITIKDFQLVDTKINSLVQGSICDVYMSNAFFKGAVSNSQIIRLSDSTFTADNIEYTESLGDFIYATSSTSIFKHLSIHHLTIKSKFIWTRYSSFLRIEDMSVRNLDMSAKKKKIISIEQ